LSSQGGGRRGSRSPRSGGGSNETIDATEDAQRVLGRSDISASHCLLHHFQSTQIHCRLTFFSSSIFHLLPRDQAPVFHSRGLVPSAICHPPSATRHLNKPRWVRPPASFLHGAHTQTRTHAPTHARTHARTT